MGLDAIKPRLTGLLNSRYSPLQQPESPVSAYNMNMQSPTPSVHVGFPKPGRNGRASTNHAAHPVVTKQRSLLSQSLLSAEADRDARRCSKLEQALDVSELSESEESAMDVEEEDVPCCNGALQIPTRYIPAAMLTNLFSLY